MTTDVERIAKNTGFPLAEIESVKKYVFYDLHQLGDETEEPRRFDASFEMAESLQRLIDGNNIQPHDITLLHHELIESGLVAKGMSQDEAHITASREYNYRKEAEEDYASVAEHQKKR